MAGMPRGHSVYIGEREEWYRKTTRTLYYFSLRVYSWLVTVSCPIRKRKTVWYFLLNGHGSSWDKTLARLPSTLVTLILPFKNGSSPYFRLSCRGGGHIRFRWFHTCTEDLEPLGFFTIHFYLQRVLWPGRSETVCFYLFINLFFQ